MPRFNKLEQGLIGFPQYRFFLKTQHWNLCLPSFGKCKLLKPNSEKYVRDLIFDFFAKFEKEKMVVGFSWGLKITGMNILAFAAAGAPGKNYYYQVQWSLMNRKLNSDHFTFLKNLNRTYGSKVMRILSFLTKHLGMDC